MRILINKHLGISIKSIKGRIEVESKKYNNDKNYQNEIKHREN